jgi:hypothetical protein
VWQIINKEIGKSILNNKKIEINCGANKLTSQKIIVELFQSYFIERVEKMTE